MDDVQFFNTLEPNKSNFDDIAVFIDRQYNISLQNKKQFWCCIDLVQGLILSTDDASFPARLLFKQNGARRNFNMPQMKLDKILRNTLNIGVVVSDIRRARIDAWKTQDWLLKNVEFGDVSVGHRITGPPVLYHKLAEGTDRAHIEAFTSKMVEEEIDVLLKQQPSFKNSDIAILHDGFKQSLTDMLQNKFNIGVYKR